MHTVPVTIYTKELEARIRAMGLRLKVERNKGDILGCFLYDDDIVTRKRALHARMSHSTICNMTVSTKKTCHTLVK